MDFAGLPQDLLCFGVIVFFIFLIVSFKVFLDDSNRLNKLVIYLIINGIVSKARLAKEMGVTLSRFKLDYDDMINEADEELDAIEQEELDLSKES